MKNTQAYFGQHSDNVSMLKKFFITDGGAKGVRTYSQISEYPEKIRVETTLAYFVQCSDNESYF